MKNVIAVIGTGGTGGNLIPLIARMLSSTYLKTTLLLVDGDTVEEKNLKRQPFSRMDIGMNKARSLAKKVEATYNCEVEYSNNYIVDVNDMNRLLENFSFPIVIGCVDNHKCRKIIHEWFERSENCVYIDSANEDDWGDCFVTLKLGGKKIFKTRGDMFPEVLSEVNKGVTEMSCEELSNVAPQYLKTNSMAANVVFNAIDSIIVKDKLPFYYSRFDLSTLSIESQYADEFSEYSISDITKLVNESLKNAS